MTVPSPAASVAPTTPESVRRESVFDKLADKVSYGMGTPRNIIFWIIAVVGWVLLFAVGGHKIASGTWLPGWFKSTGFNFPLNLVTTIAQLFIGFLVGSAANRTERANHAQSMTIKAETNEIDALLKENTSLVRETRTNTSLIEEVHRHVTALTDHFGIEAGSFPPDADQPIGDG